jgi:hypothetical protein
VTLIEFNVPDEDNILIDVPDDLDEKEKRKFIKKLLKKHSEKNPILRKFHPDTKKMAVDMMVEAIIQKINNLN